MTPTRIVREVYEHVYDDIVVCACLVRAAVYTSSGAPQASREIAKGLAVIVDAARLNGSPSSINP